MMKEAEVKVSRGTNYFREKLPFHIGEYSIAAEAIFETHSHDFVELVYVLEGGALHQMGDHSYTLSSGDLFVIEPGTLHSYTGSQHGETIVYNVLFDRNLLFQELNSIEASLPMLEFLYLSPFLRKTEVFRPHLYMKGRQKIQLEKHLETLLQETRQKDPGYQLVIKARMIECMVCLSRQYAQNAMETETQFTDEQWMETIALMIKENFDKPLALEQVIRLCGMSVTSFSGKFKAHTGKTFLDFKHDVQIRMACRLLEQTKHKIITIAHEAGFEDVGFFYRVFRKNIGMTPTQYRSSKIKYENYMIIKM